MYYFFNKQPDFDPLDVDNMILWLDGSDASTVTEAGGLVSQWDDKSGNGNHATQATGASQPTYDTTNNWIDFDDSRFMSLPYNNPSEATVFVVFYPRLIGGTVFYGGYDSNTQTRTYLGTANGRYASGIGDSSFNTLAQQSAFAIPYEPERSPKLLTWRYNASLVNSFDENRVSAQSSTVGAGSLDTGRTPLIGAARQNEGNAGLYSDGRMAELMVFNTALTEAQENAIEYYMINKWGLV